MLIYFIALTSALATGITFAMVVEVATGKGFYSSSTTLAGNLAFTLMAFILMSATALVFLLGV
jgi:hypothetical protein